MRVVSTHPSSGTEVAKRWLDRSSRAAIIASRFLRGGGSEPPGRAPQLGGRSKGHWSLWCPVRPNRICGCRRFLASRGHLWLRSRRNVWRSRSGSQTRSAEIFNALRSGEHANGRRTERGGLALAALALITALASEVRKSTRP